MKLLVSLFLLVIFLEANTCEKKTDCIDPSRIDTTAVCTMIYDPVCGCDGKTYSNSCVADHHGVSHYTSGPCEQEK